MRQIPTNRGGVRLGLIWQDLWHGETADLRRRRWIIALSLVGIVAMTPVVLLQLGVVRHLPDPPWPGFNSDAANLSESAFQFGVPDGVLVLGSLIVGLLLAALGGRDRAQERPWIPLVASGKALLDSAGAGWYFYLMLSGQEAWCRYCIVGAFAIFGIIALTLPESRKALVQAQERPLGQGPTARAGGMR